MEYMPQRHESYPTGIYNVWKAAMYQSRHPGSFYSPVLCSECGGSLSLSLPTVSSSGDFGDFFRASWRFWWDFNGSPSLLLLG